MANLGWNHSMISGFYLTSVIYFTLKLYWRVPSNLTSLQTYLNAFSCCKIAKLVLSVWIFVPFENLVLILIIFDLSPISNSYNICRSQRHSVRIKSHDVFQFKPASFCQFPPLAIKLIKQLSLNYFYKQDCLSIAKTPIKHLTTQIVNCH